jgi:hypothetical protein
MLTEDTRVLGFLEGIQTLLKIGYSIEVSSHLFKTTLEELGFQEVLSFKHRVVFTGYTLDLGHFLLEKLIDLKGDDFEEMTILIVMFQSLEEICFFLFQLGLFPWRFFS